MITGSLSDIGTQTEFVINVWDIDVNCPKNPLNNILQKELFKTLLDQRSLRILLRFGYISDVKIKEQKDSIPEHLCIDCNEQRIFSYDDDEEVKSIHYYLLFQIII